MWSYSGDPSSSPLDEVRFLVGDTDPTRPLIANEEINYSLKLVYGSTPPPIGNYLPAAYVADSIFAKFSRFVDKTVGDLSISYSQHAKQFQDLSFRLRQRATIAIVPIYAGGLSAAEKAFQHSNPDLLGTAIRIDGMTAFPAGSGSVGGANLGSPGATSPSSTFDTSTGLFDDAPGMVDNA